MFGNDFLRAVKPPFEFLSKDRGYSLVHEEVASSFDNGSLVYESPALRIHIHRDRGQVFFEVRARGDSRDCDDDILRLLLADAQHYSRPTSPPDCSVSTAAAFLRANLPAIEPLFGPARVETTMRRATELMNERGDALFGRVGGS